MPRYNIIRAQRNAKKIDVVVKPSTRKGKKVDVFSKSGEKLASIGDVNYYDFTVTRDKKRQAAYQARFAKTRNKVGTPSYYADRILWR